MLYEPWIRPELLHRLKMPVLVVAGSDDMIREYRAKSHVLCQTQDSARGTHFIAAENRTHLTNVLHHSGTDTGRAGADEPSLGQPESRKAGEGEDRRAAVLVPLIQKGGEYHVVFDARGTLKNSPGEICFPGGAVERDETPKQAAIREAMEELLISRRQIRVIAPLDVLEAPGRWNFSILGAAGPLELRWSYSEAEVDHTFSVPLRWFAEHEPERYETELVTVPEETFPFEDVQADAITGSADDTMSALPP